MIFYRHIAGVIIKGRVNVADRLKDADAHVHALDDVQGTGKLFLVLCCASMLQFPDVNKSKFTRIKE